MQVKNIKKTGKTHEDAQMSHIKWTLQNRKQNINRQEKEYNLTTTTKETKQNKFDPSSTLIMNSIQSTQKPIQQIRAKSDSIQKK